ncbi:HEPN domain-containing protein [uncultured Adlercreutzia sp.]|uniref:HEPN domain-containing protein n=1 Tax=uncultured Adlercreutzia sp. TaxID=875803 RepID=UPI0025CD87CB|nr:HEPN domain-containing protein [uncultured Adlercreutzia sp.]
MVNEQTLYDKAASNLRNAQLVLAHMDDDDAQLNFIGYHLQQATELVLKYLLEQSGVEYPKTHDIDQLIRLAEQADVDLRLPEYLDDHAEMISQWEAKSRYVIGYSIERRKVERAMEAIDAYLADIAVRESASIEERDAEIEAAAERLREVPDDQS